MRYRYLDDFRRGISVFAIFSYGIAVLGTPQCPPLRSETVLPVFWFFYREAVLRSRSGHASTPLACLEKWSLSAEVDF